MIVLVQRANKSTDLFYIWASYNAQMIFWSYLPSFTYYQCRLGHRIILKRIETDLSDLLSDYVS